MTVDPHEGHQDRPTPGAPSAGDAADALLAAWAQIDAALHPIVGHRGVAAMFHRNLGRVAASHPGLGPAPADPLGAVDTDALHAAVRLLPPAQAAAAAAALLQGYRQMLASLVGPSLTDRLLHGIWTGEAASAPPAPGTAAHPAGTTPAPVASPPPLAPSQDPHP